MIQLYYSNPNVPPSPRINPLGFPNQSRSFRILQQVTGTEGATDDSDETGNERSEAEEEAMQEQRPLYSRPLGPSDMNETQMRRLQMSENDRAFMNRVKQQGN